MDYKDGEIRIKTVGGIDVTKRFITKLEVFREIAWDANYILKNCN